MRIVRSNHWPKINNEEELRFCSMNLTEIPKELSNLIGLKVLCSSNNFMEGVPEELCYLINLRYLSFL